VSSGCQMSDQDRRLTYDELDEDVDGHRVGTQANGRSSREYRSGRPWLGGKFDATREEERGGTAYYIAGDFLHEGPEIELEVRGA
jgi:hypothetical protein